MLRFLQCTVFLFVTTWISFYTLTVLACRNGAESDMSLLRADVSEGIHNPIYYWADKIAEQSLQGDMIALVSFLDIVVRPQDCSINETVPLGLSDVEMKLRENFEQGYKITPAVCPTPAVKKWCDESFFGMRSVHFQLKGDRTVYPKDVSATYCCLETNPIGVMISQLRDNFDVFTFCGLFLFIIVVTSYFLICDLRLHQRLHQRLKRNRREGGDDSTELISVRN